MLKNLKNFGIGILFTIIISWVSLLFTSVFIGWLNWENPLGFMGELISSWVDSGVWKTIRTILTVSFIVGLLNIKIQNYLNE